MSCLKIFADENKTQLECSGDALDCLGILGGATVATLAHIAEKSAKKDPNKLVCAFCESVKTETQKKLGLVPVPEDRKKEPCGEHVCRCQKKPAASRELTLEEIAEMIGKLNNEERNRLGHLIIQRAVDSLADLAADEKPKEESVKFYPPDGSSLGVSF